MTSHRIPAANTDGARLFPDIGPPVVVSTDVVVGPYRYSLTREWDASLPRLCWGMLNPSKARRHETDPTDTRVHNFTAAWGYGSYTIFNLFGFAATDPRELMRAIDPRGPDNDRHIIAAATGHDVICAWGASVPHIWRHRPATVKALLVDSGARLYHLGLTKDGHPRHPLYLRGDTQPTRWHSVTVSLRRVDTTTGAGG